MAPSAGKRDRPWVMRTYAGHSSATRSNELFRRNLAKGQTGLSGRFDMPTQTGYDPDHELARGEVGRVGVTIRQIGGMRQMFDGIPLGEANFFSSRRPHTRYWRDWSSDVCSSD